MLFYAPRMGKCGSPQRIKNYEVSPLSATLNSMKSCILLTTHIFSPKSPQAAAINSMHGNVMHAHVAWYTLIFIMRSASLTKGRKLLLEGLRGRLYRKVPDSDGVLIRAWGMPETSRSAIYTTSCTWRTYSLLRRRPFAVCPPRKNVPSCAQQ